MSKRPTFDEFKKTAMQDEKFRTEYELLKPEFEILLKFIQAKKKASLLEEKK